MNLSLLLVVPSNFDNLMQFSTKFMIFFRYETSQIKRYLIKYNS